MRQRLNDVTLVAIGTVASELTQYAIDATLAQIDPAEVLWDHTDHGSVLDADRALWSLCAAAKTSHCLTIQYDGFVLDSDMWRAEFLDYDYIGAPWPHRGYAVGNGGFSLRSVEMMRYLIEN